ncbi:putative laccase-5 [Hordeum vulgare]|nr:putative laccase-5 [Hordeum vulgare]
MKGRTPSTGAAAPLTLHASGEHRGGKTMVVGRRRLSNAVSSRSTSVSSRPDASAPPVVGSSSAGASSSRTITPAGEGQRRSGRSPSSSRTTPSHRVDGSSAPRTISPRGRRITSCIMERSVREAEEVAAHNRREIEIEQIFHEQAVTASQASASKEADLRVMKTEQDKIWIDLDTDSDED